MNAAPPAPKFDAGASAASQASQFIAVKDKRPSKTMGKAFLSECNVLFGLETSASASTSSGLLPSSDRARRTESKVKSIFYLKGMDDAGMQALANEICANAEAKLGSTGYQMVPRASLASNPRFQAMLANGKVSPYDFKAGKSSYRIFGAPGSTVFNPQYLGIGGGLSMALKQAKGDSPWIHEAVLIEELGADAVRVNVLLDFSSLDSNDSGWDRWASKDTAEVKAEVSFALSGTISILPTTGISCHERLGMHECLPDGNKMAIFSTKNPLLSGEKFYTSIEDSTKASDTVASVLVSVLAMANGGGSTLSIKRTDVNVDPATYVDLATRSAAGFVEMSMNMAK